ncbi:hypothetical protein QBC46DRAFT_376387 [Diplogelasinospora grovesii]|uniref:Uncharacterized protein n=1 Tax=Diplogelasinospora grovesii TaxID=303347 RepID=A0AAN6NDP3_9PEZI|nr:hypothetical protein QBC46DRAFT_376387 [Diplogelasinospora grovesii]
MGLLSLFSKKSNHKSKTQNTLKARAYNTTTAGALPVRGAYPVAGNGPNLLTTLAAGSHAALSQTHVPLDTTCVVSAADRAAPSPAIPRYRDESIERPGTAPTGSVPSLLWTPPAKHLRKDSLRGPPPVSFRQPKSPSVAPAARQGPPYLLGIRDSGTHHPSIPKLHSQNDSARSSDGRKGHKDLLDAQSEIAPTDFKTRVKAAGARDYSEDVADRNLGENSINLTSPQVKAFYAQTGHHASLPSLPDVVHLYQSGDPFMQQRPRQSSQDSDIGSKPVPTPIFSPIPRRSFSYVPEIPNFRPSDSRDLNLGSTDRGIIGRRQSLNTYMPVSLSNGANGFDINRHPSLRRESGDSLRRADSHRSEDLDWDLPSQMGRSGSTSPSINISRTPQRPSSSKGPSRPRGFPRDSVLLAKERSRPSTANRAADDAMSHGPTTSERSFSLLPSNHSHRGSVPSSAFAASPRKRHSLHTFQPSVSSSIASREFAPDATPLAYPRNIPRRLSEQQEEEEEEPTSHDAGPDANDFDATDLVPASLVDSAPPAIIKTTPGQNERPEAPTSHPKTKSPIIGASKKGILDEIAESIPLRTSSNRAWSISSATATASDTSSNPFQRPQSRHTANTSVDLGGSNISTLLESPSHDSLSAVTPAGAEKAKEDNFNIDDYVSSDEYSPHTPSNHRPRGELEQELLFNDNGYGLEGSLLPGISVAAPHLPADSPPEIIKKERPWCSSSTVTTSPLFYAGDDSFGRAGGRRFIIDTAADSDSDYDSKPVEGDEGDDDDDDGFESWSHNANVSPLRGGLRGTKRLSALGTGTLYDHIRQQHPYFSDQEVIVEEEKETMMDIAAAVRLRKEVKARQRAQGISGVSSSRRRTRPPGQQQRCNNDKEKMREMADVNVKVEVEGEGEDIDDDGNHADVE